MHSPTGKSSRVGRNGQGFLAPHATTGPESNRATKAEGLEAQGSKPLALTGSRYEAGEAGEGWQGSVERNARKGG